MNRVPRILITCRAVDRAPSLSVGRFVSRLAYRVFLTVRTLSAYSTSEMTHWRASHREIGRLVSPILFSNVYAVSSNEVLVTAAGAVIVGEPETQHAHCIFTVVPTGLPCLSRLNSRFSCFPTSLADAHESWPTSAFRMIWLILGSF